MPEQADISSEEFLAFYGSEAWRDWKRLLAHFDLGDGFSFLVLLLPGAVGAGLCRRQLAGRLAAKNKRLADLPCEWMEDARRLGDRLFALEPEDDLGGIWAGSVIPESDPEIGAWKEAWRFGLGSLNQHRNTLLRRFGCPLVLVGAPWLQRLLQDAAPDLWSVRAAVVAVQAGPPQELAGNSPWNGSLREPDPAIHRGSGSWNSEIREGSDLARAQADSAAADPDYALEQAERLRGQPDSELARAVLLSRAGIGFYDHARYEPAEDCLRQAITLLKSLPSNQVGAMPKLASALNNHGNVLRALGRREEALGEAKEAASLYEALAEAQSQDFRPQLAMSLNNLANRLGELGRHEEALAPAQEAVRLIQQLAQARPEAFRPQLAASLNNLAARLSELGRREEALARAEEAVRFYEQLAEARPETFRPGLAGSLSNLANMLGDLNRREEALARAEEAVRIREQLAQARPEAFRPDLAASLNNLSNRLGDLGRREEALDRARQAVLFYEQLAQGRPEAFGPWLAMSLNNLANRLGDLGRGEEALAHAEKAVLLYEQLTRARPDVFLPNLAASRGTLGGILRGMGRHREAAASFAKGIEALAKPFQTLPKAFAARMEEFRDNYLNSAQQAGTEPDRTLLPGDPGRSDGGAQK